METYEEALHRTTERIENHKMRYMKHYGIDPYIADDYNLVLDAEHHTPDTLCDMILRAYEQWLKN